GQEPHGALLTTYVSDGAYDAITQRKGVMPDGAIIIKENYMPGKNLATITVMKKIKGYNKEAGDWFWVKFLPDGRVETMESNGMKMVAAGKVGMCISCHSARAENDYLYTGTIK
ncbi:MAG: cytochrome P460 family protein, partial [Candidatus Caldarchaeum sp.]